MKKSMIAIALLLTGVAGLQAVGDLQISLQGTNVVLSWASTNSDYYLVQYSTNLHSSHPWQTLTNWMPGSDGTNTVFVHSGAFQLPTASPDSLGYNELLSVQTLNQEEVSLAMRADDPNSAAPVFLYPPGFDFSGFLLYDPVTQTWRSGNGFTRDNPPNPLNPGTNTNSTVTMPVMYFYRVGRNGVYLSGLTNGTTLSGTVSIPLEVVGIEGETVAGVSLFDNGSLIKVIDVSSNSIPDHVDLDTTRLGNGVHNITAWIECIPSYSNETNYVQMTSESSPVSLSTSNEISFPDWMDDFGEIGNRLSINAQTIYTNVPVRIDVIGSQGTNLLSLGGYIYENGEIDVGWPNLVNPFLNTNYFHEPYFLMSINVLDGNGDRNENQFTLDSDGYIAPRILTVEEARRDNRAVLASAIKRKFRSVDTWNTEGMWTVVYQSVSKDYNTEDKLLTSVQNFRKKIREQNLDVFPSVPDDDQVFVMDSVSQCNILKTNLIRNESRNFFYFGHATPDWIGIEPKYITAEEITSLLHTNSENNHHSYRFVFLYGCETANGGLAKAFGISSKKVAASEFAKNSLRQKAFVGWKNQHIATSNDATFIEAFINDWTVSITPGRPLKEALENASRSAGMTNDVSKNLEIYGTEYLRFWVDNYASVPLY